MLSNIALDIKIKKLKQLMLKIILFITALSYIINKGITYKIIKY